GAGAHVHDGRPARRRRGARARRRRVADPRALRGGRERGRAQRRPARRLRRRPLLGARARLSHRRRPTTIVSMLAGDTLPESVAALYDAVAAGRPVEDECFARDAWYASGAGDDQTAAR